MTDKVKWAMKQMEGNEVRDRLDATQQHGLSSSCPLVQPGYYGAT
jgi:hypothetical protein